MRAKAKTIDGDVVEGYYNNADGDHTVFHSKGNSDIDPTTLEYQIGSEWYSMEELEEAVASIKWMELNSNSGLCDFYNRQEERKPFTYIGGGDNPPTCAECGSECSFSGCHNPDCEHYFIM